MDLIINTIPARVLDKKAQRHRTGCVDHRLASHPGGE